MQPEQITGQLVRCGPDIRLESLRLAVDLYAHREQDDFTGDAVLHAAGEFAKWLTAPAAHLHVGTPVISPQGRPAVHLPLHRTGPDMAVTIKDTQVATYPAASEADSKGFPVSGAVTVAEDSGGTVVALAQDPDGSAAFTAVAPGTAQVSWTDGVLVFADTVNVVPGDAATLVVGAPVVTDQPAAPTT